MTDCLPKKKKKKVKTFLKHREFPKAGVWGDLENREQEFHMCEQHVAYYFQHFVTVLETVLHDRMEVPDKPIYLC